MSEIDLTQLEPSLLISLYSKLKQVLDDGNICGPPPGDNTAETYELIRPIKVEKPSTTSEEAVRLYCAERRDCSQIAESLGLADSKDALELLLDYVCFYKAKINLKSFSLVPMMKELFVGEEEVECVRGLVSDADSGQLGIRDIITKSGFLSPSVLELILVILYAETQDSCLYKDVVRAYKDIEENINEETVDVDEALTAFDDVCMEIEQSTADDHAEFMLELKKLETVALDNTKQFENIKNRLEEMSQKAKEVRDERIRRQLKMIEENVVEVMDDTEPLSELVPTMYRSVAVAEVEVVQESKGGPPPHMRLPPLPNSQARPRLESGHRCFVLHTGEKSENQRWIEAEIDEVRVVLEQNRYKVRYSATETIAGSAVWVTAKNLAYAEKPCWRLEEGVRVVGQYRDDTNQTFDGWYAGTVGEKPASYNGHRYLIFFDDGGVQYLKSEDLRLIYAQKENPRETYLDIPEAFEPLKLFMEGYLQRYPERMMVRVRRPREKIKAERLGRWYVNKGEQATVVEIDASLIKVRFPTNPPVEEWLFRGSPRLWEVSDKQKDTKRHRVSRQPTQRRRVEMVNDSVVHLQKARKSTVPRTQRSGYREFFDNDWSSESSDSDSSEREEEDIFKEQQFGYLSRRGLADFRILEETLPPNRRKPADIRNHGFGSCSRRCIPARRDEEAAMLQVKGKSPFMAPLLCGWNRQLAELDDRKKKMVYYIAPCGRRLRGVSEMIKYLKVTGSTLPGDYFTFDRSVQPLRMYKVVGALFEMEDYSKGNENVPISVVNTFTTEPPPDISYSADRYPWEGVTIPKICSGCNCEDDCSDPKKCSCQKLTMEEVMCLVPDDRPPVHRRTYQTERRLAHYGKTGIKSGIFECNDTCRCRVSRCVNRVAQRPLMIPLQLFKTAEKGWGIRTLIDVPKGQFICIYAGAILSDEVAETLGGEMEGADEYFADLDLIAAVEREKEGYESGEETDEGEEEEEVIPHEKDGREDGDSRSGSMPRNVDCERVDASELPACFWAGEGMNVEESIETSPTARKAVGGSTSPQNSMMPKAAAPQQQQGSDRFSLTQYYGNEFLYVVDAKSCGNIGRYLNHSCDPNVFVQNVLVDTHDLRFPWVAFFALRTIKAGEELCWDYNYDPTQTGKAIVCRCGAKTCRKRLR